jgi:hypothetical protein
VCICRQDKVAGARKTDKFENEYGLVTVNCGAPNVKEGKVFKPF